MKNDVLRTKLKNGLRVILVPKKGSLATTVMVMVEAGSKYETKEINGISHFLEHMCFKGTKDRPRPIDIASELDALGAQYNAFTGQEFTAYYAKAKNENFHAILDVVSDLYLNPVFDPAEIEKEKGVIVEELNMYEDTPARHVHDLFMELVYGDQPAGWNVGGRKEVIRKLTRNDFIDYRDAHYLPQSTIVVVAGGFDSKNAVKKIEERFSIFAKGVKNQKRKVIESQKKPQELAHFKESDQTHLILGFRACDTHDTRRFALEVMAEILGGGMSSRLFQSIREELGAAYYVHADANLLSDHGMLFMGAGAEHSKLELVIRTALHEFSRMKHERVSIQDLKKAKEHLLGNLFLSLETSDELANFYSIEEIMGIRLSSPEALAKEIKAVTADEVRATARAFVKNDRLNLAVIGPFRDKSFLDILKVE